MKLIHGIEDDEVEYCPHCLWPVSVCENQCQNVSIKEELKLIDRQTKAIKDVTEFIKEL